MAAEIGVAIMAVYGERNIKDLLSEYPALGDVLSAFGIGCVTCAVGTCALKDIVEYHFLPEDQARDLTERLAQTITAGGTATPQAAASEPATPRDLAYSAPIQALVDEHKLIKRLLARIPALLDSIDLEIESDRQAVLDGIDFIRSYADRYHHAKEEDILFQHAGEGQEIIRVMLEDHTTGRGHVCAMIEAIGHQDHARLAEHLLAYRELLTEHIRKEDDILYPWIDRQLSPADLETLARDFAQADQAAAAGTVERCTAIIERLERH